MSGNTIGKLFTLTTFGESHGLALGGIIDGCPPGMSLSEADIQPDLDRRKPGTSKFTTQRREDDQVEILSGVFEGKTTGTPIGLLIRNKDQRSKDYSEIKDKYRPGHADFTYDKKYGIRDYRGGGRSSARETAIRVAAGAVAKKYLKDSCGIQIQAYVSQIGDLKINQIDWGFIETNALFCPDPTILNQMEDFIDTVRKTGDSIGAKIDVVAQNVPVGLGEPIFNKLDVDIAAALMSINAVKGVEIGAGFDSVSQKGSEHRDQITPEGFISNNSGGILGGISSGQDIKASLALKPASSILIEGNTVDKNNTQTTIVTKGRHDPCVGIRAVPIAEAMLALVLIDHLLRHRGQNFDVIKS